MNVAIRFPIRWITIFRATIAKLRVFALFFAMQLCQYTIYTISLKAIQHSNLPASFSIDLAYSALQFTIIKKIAKDNDSTVPAALGYSFGGATGTCLGIVFAKMLLG